MALRHGAPASLFATAPRPSSSRWLFATAPRPSSSRWRSAAAPRPAPAPASTCPGQHLLRPAPAPASSSTSAPGQSSRRPASNKPHSAEKSTPVWLAIWRTWAGFANSQLWRAAFRCTYSYICTHPRYCHLEPLLRQTQICRPICPDCLRHLRISAE